MLITDRPQSESESTAAAGREIRLRVRGGARDLETIRLQAGNHSIGSGRKCTIRLADAGVRPMHCLISHCGEGAKVRRWGIGTLLNGRPFDEELLAGGDRLSIGPIELEVIGAERDDVSRSEFASDGGDTYPAIDDEPAGRSGIAVEKSLADLQASVVSLTSIDERPLPEAPSASKRVRNRKTRLAIRRHREDSKALLARIEDLGEKLELVLAKWEEGSHRLSTPITGAATAARESDLAAARSQLAVALLGLGAAQATIDDLELRLSESRQLVQESSDERSAWRQQVAELEGRLAEQVAESERLRDEVLASQENAEHPGIGKSGATAWGNARVERIAPTAPDALADGPPIGSLVFEEEASDEIWSAEPSGASEPASHEESYDWSARPAAEEYVPESVEPADWETGSKVGTAWTLGEEELAVESDAGELEERDVTSAIERPEVVTPTKPASAEEEGLAHLRELSLWRGSPPLAERGGAAPDVAADPADIVVSLPRSAAMVVAPESGEAERPVDDATAVAVATAKPSPPTSFIERYAHMFEQDGPAELPRTPASIVASRETTASAGSPSLAAPSGTPVVATPSAAGDGEDTIEQYMARMMQRIRGDAALNGSTSGSQAVAFAKMNAAAIQPAVERGAAREISVGVKKAADSSSDSSNEQSLISLAELKSKVPTPEFSTDMGALRALANQTARHAIGIHTARTLRRNALTRVIVSLLAGTTSLYFMLSAPDWRSHEFSTGCVAMIASIYWGRLTFVSLLKAVRVGAFDEIATDFTPVEKPQPSLPIDVVR
jgi:FHA domain